MIRKINRRRLALATAAFGFGVITAPAIAQEGKKISASFLARIENLEPRKGGDGNAYTIVTYQVLKQTKGSKSGKYGAPGQRHVVVKKDTPPKSLDIGSSVVVEIDGIDLQEISYPNALVPPNEDPMPYCCIPVIIWILGGDSPPIEPEPPKTDPPETDPPEGGEGTDPDKDEDSDEDTDVDTDGFRFW
ncbi:MAG: hypothetical protein AAF429_15275 [Pseudomonadota bacterium]